MEVLVDILSWHLATVALATAYLPLCRTILHPLPGIGANFALGIGVFAYGMVCTALWTVGLYNPSPAFHLLILVASAAAVWSWFDRPTWSEWIRAQQSLGIWSLAFLFWCLIRAADPAIAHTEQPMDLMLIKSAMSSPQFPLADAWLAGETVNYYAGGHRVLGYLAHLAGSPPSLAVNLGQAFFFALCFQLSFALGSALCGQSRIAGFFSAFALLFSSNPAGFLSVIRGEVSASGWWWWSATRCITDTDATGTVELITEFPFFSFWLGDNHAHVLGIPFLLLALALALSLSRYQNLRIADAILPGFLTGFTWTANAWQFPTTLAIVCLPVLASSRGTLRQRIHFVTGILLTSSIVALPHLLVTTSMTEGIQYTGRGVHTSFSEKLLVFGFLLPPAGLAFLAPHPDRNYTRSLLILAGAMVLVCDYLQVEDVFGSRMNTVFKAYYQVWILLAVFSGPGLITSIHTAGSVRALAVCMGGLLLLGSAYPVVLLTSSLRTPKQSLDAVESIGDPDRKEVIHYGITHLAPGTLAVEAPGHSYDATTSILSTWTAAESVVGWLGHQHQWNRGHMPRLQRINQATELLANFYQADSLEALEEHLNSLRPEVVLLGPNERTAYTLHPDWDRWMRIHYHRSLVNETYQLYRIKR